MTMNPPIGHGEFLTLSYFPANATEATQIQDAVGNTAARFMGKRVRNETPEPPHIDEIAFVDEAQTYAIDAIIGIEATFSETVTVTTSAKARPRLELIVGSNRRHALYVSGSGSNTLRLEYTVVDGDSDSDGIGFARNSFETPTGSSIATTAASAAVDLDHFPSDASSNWKVDGVRPAVASASARGLELTLTFTEELDESATLAPSSFTVTTKSGSSRTVTGVTVQGKDVKLALARGIAPGNGAATVDYTPPATDAVRDLVGNTAGAFEDQSVNVTAVANNVARGTVTIAVQGAGTATVGQTVQGTVSDDVEDPDGLESPTYTYQWVRVDGSSETDIAGATATSYILTASDAGKKLKLKASFRDILNNAETLTSAVWPTSTRITWAADANCGVPSEITNGTREQIWTGQVTVGTQSLSGTVVGYGYNTISTSTGSLSDTTFELGGNAYTIAQIGETALASFLSFSVTTTLGTTSTSSLKLHVCDANFEFSSAAHTVTATGESTYQWASTGLDWSTVTTRRVYLSTVDTRAPVLVRTTVDGSTVTLTYDERLKATSPTATGIQPSILIRTLGTRKIIFAVSNIAAGVGPGGQDVTMTITPEAHHRELIPVSYNRSKEPRRPHGSKTPGRKRSNVT